MTDLGAILFDVDGTLLDTREWIFSAFENSMRVSGSKVIPRQEIRPKMGQSLESCYEAFIPSGDIDRLVKTHMEYQLQHLDIIKPYPGLKELLQSISDLKTALVTSRKGSLMVTLERAGIDKSFDVIVAAKDVTKHKPHPEGILLALEKLEVQAKQAVMVGDGIADMQAAKNAGVAAVGITHGFGTKEDLIDAGAVHIVGSLSELRELLEKLRS
ncbi:MAG: HAD family hydrolase [Candidatus Saccharimonadales bacterium]|nr:HAD family hydrolase [Candidatus Saccharimonadales bacterium]